MLAIGQKGAKNNYNFPVKLFLPCLVIVKSVRLSNVVKEISHKVGECWKKILEQKIFPQAYRELQIACFEPLAPPLVPLQLASPESKSIGHCEKILKSPLEFFLCADLVVLSPLGQSPL